MNEEAKQTSSEEVNALMKVGTPFDSKQYIEGIKHSIKEGLVDPLAVYTVLKRMNKISEEIFKDKDIKDIVNNEADKHLSGNTKTFNLYSATITKMAVYTTYDFKGCGHPVLDELYKIQEEVKERIKNIEEELKLLIPKTDNTKIGFGIEDSGKAIIVENIPELVLVNSGETVRVQAPQKIQQIGLKFMKI